jgi:hypothetical protein
MRVAVESSARVADWPITALPIIIILPIAALPPAVLPTRFGNAQFRINGEALFCSRLRVG